MSTKWTKKQLEDAAASANMTITDVLRVLGIAGLIVDGASTRCDMILEDGRTVTAYTLIKATTGTGVQLRLDFSQPPKTGGAKQ